MRGYQAFWFLVFYALCLGLQQIDSSVVALVWKFDTLTDLDISFILSEHIHTNLKKIKFICYRDDRIFVKYKSFFFPNYKIDGVSPLISYL